MTSTGNASQTAYSSSALGAALAGLAGKTVRVAGMPAAQEGDLRRVLENFGLVVSRVNLLPGLAAEASDAAVLACSAGTGLTVGEMVEVVNGLTPPVLLLGGRGDYFEQCLGSLRRPDSDFLFEPWIPSEVLLRLARLMNSAAAVPVLEKQAGTARGVEEVQQMTAGAAMTPCVLITDDDPDVAPLVGTSLQRLGVSCFSAENGRKGLEMAQQLRPRVMVLDVSMPDMDGFEVLLSLKRDQRFRDTKVLMLTARSNQEDVMRGFGYGADDYVTKPFMPLEVAARVTRLMEA